MKPRRITLQHVSKQSHIIVRVEPELRARLQRIAILERRNLSDLARLVFEDYINHQERAMNLTLRDKPAASSTLEAAQTAAVAAAELSYGAKRGKRKK